jgi:hypothetical protein
MHQSVQFLSDTIASSATTSNQSFPFVTVPLFEVYGDTARIQSGFESVTYTPLVLEQEVSGWINYSLANQNWLLESRAIVVAQQNVTQQVVSAKNGSIPAHVYQFNINGSLITSLPPGPYAPTWQTSPPPLDPNYVNFNTLSTESALALSQVIQATRGTFDCVADFVRFIKIVGLLTKAALSRFYRGRLFTGRKRGIPPRLVGQCVGQPLVLSGTIRGQCYICTPTLLLDESCVWRIE